ncbi:MAG: phosphoribosyl-AMP cyclohydrolase [Anaerolineae bacterium]|nr:phosphoribosyl-AMP cyclohydrolase [Anaerolineae bacterium]
MVAKTDIRQLEEGNELLIDFEKLGQVAQCGEAIVPVAVQDADSKEVLFVAYVNEAALRYALEHGVATFWSTSRNELWVKGQTSGDTLQLVEVRVNCEQNSLLYLVRPLGQGACHTKDAADGTSRRSCYYRRIEDGKLEFVE